MKSGCEARLKDLKKKKLNLFKIKKIMKRQFDEQDLRLLEKISNVIDVFYVILGVSVFIGIPLLLIWIHSYLTLQISGSIIVCFLCFKLMSKKTDKKLLKLYEDRDRDTESA